MTRIPVKSPDDMNEAQRRIHDRVLAANGRTGFGPAIGYAHSAEVWRLHFESSSHLEQCSLTGQQVRIISLLTVRHWKSAYPWAAQAKRAAAAGLDPDIIEAINDGARPVFADGRDELVHDVTRELLRSGTLSDASFRRAAEMLGYESLADIVGAIGHFCTTALMANVVGVEPAPDAPSQLRSE